MRHPPPAPMLISARHGQASRSLRPLPHRLPPHRRRPHRPLQLALGAPPRAAPSSSASRTPTGSAPRRRRCRPSSRAMRWLGLDWDEGPDVGGPHRPYFQTQRLDLYKAHAERLVRGGQGLRLLLHEGGAGRAAQGGRGGQGAVPLPGHLPRAPYDPSRPPRHPAPRPGDRRDHLRRPGQGRHHHPARHAPGRGHPARRRRAALQLRRGGRRRHHGDQPGGPRRRPRQQHRPADPAVPGAGLPGPDLRPLPDDPRARTRPGSPSATARPASRPTGTWASCPRRW